MAEPRSDWSAWRKSTWSGTGSCVEVRRSHDQVQMRDSKAPSGGVLTFGHSAWRAFLDRIHDGEFTVPARE